MNHLLYSHRLFYFFLKESHKSLILKKFIQKLRLDKNTTLYYTYWFHRSALALTILKQQSIVKYMVSRVHGVDLYDERWDIGMVPFRGYILDYIDILFPISLSSKEYLEKKIKADQVHKLSVSKLGVQVQNSVNLERPVQFPNFSLISVANLYPLKRIHEIPEILNKINEVQIHWYHFGDGPLREKLMSTTENMKSNIKFFYFGQKDNQEIIKFYKENYIDLFISISLSEGLPVSIMEAMSFGIPIFAINTGGIPELVNQERGIIINPDCDYSSMGSRLEKMLIKINDYDRAKIKDFADKNCSDFINYGSFIEKLQSIQ